jgi:hypothetical protein
MTSTVTHPTPAVRPIRFGLVAALVAAVVVAVVFAISAWISDGGGGVEENPSPPVTAVDSGSPDVNLLPLDEGSCGRSGPC